jgi:glycosyltransferase involved in cell wall biosynthesis
MKILIDVLGYLTESRSRGIGRYTKELTTSMVNLAGPLHDIHILINFGFDQSSKETAREFSKIFGSSNVHYWRQPVIRDVFDFSSAEFVSARAIYALAIRNIGPDAVVFTEPFTQSIGLDALAGSGIKTFPVVYDLIPAVYPDDYLANPIQKLWYEHRMREVASAETILTISDSSKVEIETLIPSCCPVVSIGCDTSSNLEDYKTEFDNIGGLDVAGKEFILYVGGYDYRKSVDLLIKAHGELNVKLGKNYSLLLGGKVPDLQRSELNDIARKAGCAESVHFLGYISDQELSWLYRNCLVYVNPSKHEGFGLTILEAMRCQAPVLAADNTNTRELIEIDEAKFETLDLGSLVEKLTAIVSNDSIRDKIVEYGDRKEKQYSWSLIAKAALNVIEQSGSVVAVNKVDKSKVQLDNFAELKRFISNQKLANGSLIELAKSINGSMLNKVHQKTQMLVDITILVRTDAGSGVQRVVRSILSEFLLGSSGYDVKPVYFCFGINQFKYAEVEQNDSTFKFRTTDSGDCIDIYPGDVFLGLDLNHNVVVNHRDVLERLINSPALVYFVVYDLLPIQFPEFFDDIHKIPELHVDWLQGISKSDGVFCISKVVSEEVGAYFQSRQIPLHDTFVNRWFKLGADIDRSLGGGSVANVFSEKCAVFKNGVTLLMVGTLEPRKGHLCVLDAFEHILNTADVNLVLVGGRGWKSAQLLDRIEYHPQYNKKLFLYIDLSDESLCKLYDSSTGLIAASYGEGFGLPIIEAARHGIPVLARDIPVFREVGGDQISYFCDDAPEPFANEIIGWLKKIERGHVQVSSLSAPVSWAESAKNLFEVIEESKN